MRVLLKHSLTGHYYMGRSEWTMEEGDAGDFVTIERALQRIVQDKLDGMSIVVIHDESGAQQVFDLSGEIPESSPRREGQKAGDS